MSDKLYRSSRHQVADMHLDFSAFGIGKASFGEFDPAFASGCSSPTFSNLLIGSRPQSPKSPSAPASIDAKIYTLESKARTLRAALETVELELAATRCVRARIRNAAAPSCRLPESMLAEIFQLTLDTCYVPPPLGSQIRPSQKRRDDEWALLSAISSTSYHWRSVVLNAPRLWCHVEAHLGHFDAKFRCFLERSRAAPLHITLNVDDSPSSGTETPNGPGRTTSMKLHTWIRALAPHLERAETLVLRSKDQCAAESLFPFPARLPLLKSFKWIMDDRTQQTAVPQGWVAPMLLDMDISHCRALESVKISRRGLGTPLPLAWDDRIIRSLKELTIEGWAGFPDVPLIRLIGNCTSLKSLVWIRAVDSDDETHLDDDEHVIPTLQSSSIETLRLDFTIHDRTGSDVFKQMQFPSLKHLTIYSGDSANIQLADAGLLGQQSTNLSGITDLSSITLKPRFPQIETAWLSLFTFSPERVVSFMDAHPSLRAFGCALRASFVEMMHKLSEPASVVPWVVRAPHIETIYVICAAYSWDGEHQSQECIDGLCAALRALLTTRRAGLGAPSSRPSTPMSSNDSLHLTLSEPSIRSGMSMMGMEVFNPTRPFKVHLNDRSWADKNKITPEYLQIAKDFPDNVVLTGEEDDPPAYFHHII